MKARRYELIVDQLAGIELQLRQLGFWQDTRPSSEQLASVLPFCCDTLDFPQWLQFVFLEKMRFLLEAEGPLPSVCGIAPYSQEYFEGLERQDQTLLAHLAEIDKLLSGKLS